jgi:hypothetical protein
MTITKPPPTPLTQNQTVNPGECRTSGDFSPLGIRLAVEADRAALLNFVAETCGGWEGEPQPGLLLRLGLTVGSGPFGTGSPEVAIDHMRLRILGEGVDAWADAETGVAGCAVHAALLEQGQVLRDEVLDPLLLFLLTRSGRTPLHAAGFLAGDLGVLLLGPSGAGKSCLALAAQEAGYALLSDDTVYVQSWPDFRVWGIPRPIHLFPGDAPKGAGGAMRLRSGRLKHAVPVRATQRAPAAPRAALCLLARGEQARLEPIAPAELLGAAASIEPGFDLLRADIEATLTRLGEGGAWRLTLSADPAEAIDLLTRNLDRLCANAAR